MFCCGENLPHLDVNFVAMKQFYFSVMGAVSTDFTHCHQFAPLRL